MSALEVSAILCNFKCDKIVLSSDIKEHRLKITELEEFVSIKKTGKLGLNLTTFSNRNFQT